MDDKNNKDKNKRKQTGILIGCIAAFLCYLFLSMVETVVNQTYQQVYVANATPSDAEKVEKEEKEYDTVDYELSLLEIVDDQEVWKTYDVKFIDQNGYKQLSYFFDNSINDGCIIKVTVDTEADGMTFIDEVTDNKVFVRHLGVFKESSMHIKNYDKIEVKDSAEETESVEDTESSIIK